MDALADLMDEFNQAEIRVTHEQNLVFFRTCASKTSLRCGEAQALGLATANHGLVTDIICCPGSRLLRLGQGGSINHRAEDRRALCRSRTPARPLASFKIKISGCINACGHHHVGQHRILGVDRKA